ncbi:hypothetical protein SJAG_03582 [Schizosaccharomyces japonicus yFS275]|uniref:Uncharacterized protein n=1 Tax=Schizosaccharomyces japonicus (strain yFS275 / FY16936) TaxID=402676 RepID=B6K4M0_SCHJY|nr:hypothetical protein SJAG_03582 [Schizosaccharomyces japonicus yFS275]EEB08427.1 hypothetical protein SJAG_03582 [Schizosaccharomyces japonicus yFS275]
MTSHQTGPIEAHWNDPSSVIFVNAPAGNGTKKTKRPKRPVMNWNGSVAQPPANGTVNNCTLDKTIDTGSVPAASLPPLTTIQANTVDTAVTSALSTTSSPDSVQQNVKQVLSAATKLPASMHSMLVTRVNTSLLVPETLSKLNVHDFALLDNVCSNALSGNTTEAKSQLVRIMCAGVMENYVRWCPSLRQLVENLA